MVREGHKESFERDEILYDKPVIEHLVEEYGPATEIKNYVKTPATVYEIRAATWYWVFDKGCPRTSDESNASAHVWKMAKAVDEGRAEI